jgi:SOS response regulatory protein OraA/RecX
MTKLYRRAPAPTREEYRASAIAKLRRIGYTDEEIRAFWRPSTEEEEARRRLGDQASAG